MTTLEFGWLIGIIEGEGSLYVVNDRKYRYPRLSVEMTDRDVVEKVHKYVGVGTVNGPYTRHGNKPSWCWRLNKKQEVVDLLLLIYPHLGERRQARAAEMLEEFRK
jgi:hypothetical protein